MLSLIIDTSAGTAVALVDLKESASGAIQTQLRAQRSTPDPRHHAEQLAPMVSESLAEVGATMGDLGCIVVGTGPAPFTGLRVGLATARTIAHTLGVPLLGVPSLDALARTVFDAITVADTTSGVEGKSDSEKDSGPENAEAVEVAVVTDARRREVYAARYRAKGADDVRAVTAPFVDRPDRAAHLLVSDNAPIDGGVDSLELWGDRQVAGELRLAGPGAALYPQELPPSPGLPSAIDLTAMARIALARRSAVQRGDADVPGLGTEPLYLRRPDIHQGGAPR